MAPLEDDTRLSGGEDDSASNRPEDVSQIMGLARLRVGEDDSASNRPGGGSANRSGADSAGGPAQSRGPVGRSSSPSNDKSLNPDDVWLTEPSPATGRVTLGSGKEMELADPLARLVARAIDVVLFWVPAGLIFFLIVNAVAPDRGRYSQGFFSDSTDALDRSVGDPRAGGVFLVLVLAPVILAGLWFIYESVTVAMWGKTIGKAIMRIRVVRAADGLLLSMDTSFTRCLLPPVLAVMLPFAAFVLVPLCYLAVVWNHSRQGWHDRSAGTVVVRA